MKKIGFFLHPEDRDPLFDDAARLIIENDNASASFIQRKLSIGYARAARILDELMGADIIGPGDGSAPRPVYIKSYEEYRRNSSVGHAQKFAPPHKPYVTPEFSLKNHQTTPWGKPLAAINFDKPLIPLGYDEAGELVTSSLDELGHMLVIGNPQSKKMEFLDTIILSLLVKNEPKDINMVFIDESGYLNLYRNLPHFLAPGVVGQEKAPSVLQWLLLETSRRNKLFYEAGVRNFHAYTEKSGENNLPRIILISRLTGHNQLLDSAYTQITSYGYQTGIQLILVVDQASGSFISTQVKSNIPNRLVFQTTTSQDSLSAGVSGAHKLSTGQAILKLNNSPEKVITTIYVSDEDVKEVVEAISKANE